MKSLVIAGVVMVSLLTHGVAWAQTECKVPMANWQSREALRQQLERQGVQVQRIKVDDGCYEVRGIDAQGKRFKAAYAPDSLQLLKMKTQEDHQGERRRERGQDAPYSVSTSFVSRREAAGSANARQGEVTTTRMI